MKERNDRDITLSQNAKSSPPHTHEEQITRFYNGSFVRCALFLAPLVLMAISVRGRI
jgi:hypothetical protein